MARYNLSGSSPDTVTGLVGWWKADSITSLSDSDPVSTWNDSSSSANNLTNTGTNRPTYKTNILNGKPVVRFAGASTQYLTKGSISGMTSQVFSIFAVVRPAALGANIDIFHHGNAVGGIRYILNSDNKQSLIRAAQAVLGESTSTVTDTTNFTLVCVTNNSSDNMMFYKSALGNGSTTTSNTFIFTDNNITIGVDIWNTSAPFNGDIAEVIYFDNVLSEQNRIQIERYCANKYGVPASIGRTLIA